MPSRVYYPVLLLSMIQFFLIVSLYPGEASSRAWHISQNGQGDAPTIQAGIDSASHGDIVLVGAGRYLESEPTISGNIIVANRVVRTQPFGNLTGFGGGLMVEGC